MFFFIVLALGMSLADFLSFYCFKNPVVFLKDLSNLTIHKNGSKIHFCLFKNQKNQIYFCFQFWSASVAYCND